MILNFCINILAISAVLLLSAMTISCFVATVIKLSDMLYQHRERQRIRETIRKQKERIDNLADEEKEE